MTPIAFNVGRPLALLLALAAAAACENPTAPRMLETVESAPVVPDEFLRRYWVLDSWLARADLGHNHDKPATVTVTYDAAQQHFRAAVIERVYLPPPYDHGRPVSRRTLLVWNDTAASAIIGEFGPGRSDLTPSLPARVDMNDPEFLFQARGALSAIRDANPKTWRSDAGIIDIADVASDEPCPPRMTEGDVYAHGRKVECTRTRYRVSFDASMARVDTEFGAIALGIIKRTTSLGMAPQEVTGIRLTVHCPQTYEIRGQGDMCGYRFAFWRNADQYASTLGLDLGALRMMPLWSPQMFFTDLVVGTGAPVTSGVDQPLTYTIRRPDGTVIARSTAPVPRGSPEDPVGGEYADGMRTGGRRRLLLFLPVPWRPPYTHLPTEPVVVDFEVHPEAPAR